MALPVVALAESHDDPPEKDPVDITFPVSGLEVPEDSFTDDYEHPRGDGRQHWATDIMGPMFTPVHAAVGGTVTFAPGADECWGGSDMPSYGWMLRIAGDDGRIYSYVHLNDVDPGDGSQGAGIEWAYAPGIDCSDEGSRVERGQWIGFMGDSGNAKGGTPHLHFEICDPDLGDCNTRDGRLNPYEHLHDALDRGDVPPVPTEWADLLRSGGGEHPAMDGPTESSPFSQPFERVSGPTREGTAAALSARREAADDVIIAAAASPASALAASSLAGALDAPVLLTFPTELAKEAEDEITRLGAGRAWLIGTADELDGSIAQSVRDAGASRIERIDAVDAVSLSAGVARRLMELEGTPDTVVLARGDGDETRGWSDAISASSLAARLSAPVLLTPPDALPAELAELLGVLEPARIVVVGGTNAVSAETAEAAAQAADVDTPSRLSGPTRYATSVAVATALRELDGDRSQAWIATGLSEPDALAAGPAVAAEDGVLVLVDGQRPEAAAESRDWIADEGLTGPLVVVGGTVAVTNSVASTVARTLAR